MKNFFLGILSIFSFTHVHAQGKFSGTVKDKTIGIPIPSVNIFISELNSGTRTDSAGNFHFNVVPPGKFHVQFSHVGYGSFVAEINMTGDISLNVEMLTTAIEEQEIVITAPYNSSGDKTAYNIEAISKDDMRSSGSLTLTGAICAIPGVSQLSLGSGITKPIIRGLRSNRVLTILNGFRFDNQQWQDEHGLGISDMGIDRVEVIKGPASVLYGSDAMGGVINLVEDAPAPIGKTTGGVSFKLNTNTVQAGGEVTVKHSTERMNWKLNFGGESNTNYVDGKGGIAFNTRFNGSAMKLAVGFNRAKFVTTFNYAVSDYFFGFVDAGEFTKPMNKAHMEEERYTRTMEDAFHNVIYNLIYNKTTFFLKNSRIVMDAGIHINNRNEVEGAAEAANGNLALKLNNYSMNLKWIKPIGEKNEFILGTQDMYVSNKNIGTRYLIPNAVNTEISAYSFMKHTLKKLVIEEGVRFNLYTIKTEEHGTTDSLIGKAGGYMPALDRSYNSVNGSVGFAYELTDNFGIKLNLATGYRAPNLAELSANAFHEGFVYYEKGDPNMKSEQNLEGDLTLEYGTQHFKIEVSTFYNDIMNFIYLAPGDTFYLNRFIYYHKQTDAVLYGGEGGFDWEPEFAKWLDIKSFYSTVTAADKAGNSLPLMPADRINSEVKIRFKDKKKLSNSFVMLGVANVFEQTRISSSETITPAYTLINFSTGGSLKLKKLRMEYSIYCNNLTNTYYYNNLSLVRPGTMPQGRGFYEMGRNLGVVLKFPIGN